MSNDLLASECSATFTAFDMIFLVKSVLITVFKLRSPSITILDNSILLIVELFRLFAINFNGQRLNLEMVANEQSNDTALNTNLMLYSPHVVNSMITEKSRHSNWNKWTIKKENPQNSYSQEDSWPPIQNIKTGLFSICFYNFHELFANIF